MFDDLRKLEKPLDREKLCKSFSTPNYLFLAKNLAVKDAYSEDNLVHYCVSNSHIAILSKILSLEKDHNL